MRLKQRFGYGSMILVAMSVMAAQIAAQDVPGLKPGSEAPAFSLKDSNNKEQNLSTLTGSKGLLLLFFRSADWCPFCKGQLVDLEAAQKAFADQGISVAAVSYDSPVILAEFAKRKSITYPLLSDPSSTVIDAFGIRNTEATQMQAGIPYPGFYLIRPDGLIEKRFFETAYVNRLTASNLYDNLFGDFPIPTPAKELNATPHLKITSLQSDVGVTPGAVVKVGVTMTPGPDTHIYAPGAEKLNYHVVALTILPSELYSSSGTSYPKSETVTFPDLGETVPVYSGKTVITASVAATVNSKTIPVFAKDPTLLVKGSVAYQACTSKVCFPPASTPVEWTIGLKPLDRERVSEAIQHK
jgi:peroxiredoxin